MKTWWCQTTLVPPGYRPKGSQTGNGLCAGSSTVPVGDGVPTMRVAELTIGGTAA